MKTGHGDNISDDIRSFACPLTDPIFGVQYRMPNETHLFLPSGSGTIILSLPPHTRPRKYKITRFEIVNQKIKLFIHPLGVKTLKIRESIDYPFRDCHFTSGDENCRKLEEIALNEGIEPCPGCDVVKFQIYLWQIPKKTDKHPWLCERLDPVTGETIHPTVRYCKYCKKDISSPDPRVKYCSPEHRYEQQKDNQKERRRRKNEERQYAWTITPRRCKHCGGILTGKQRNWCGERCRKIESRKKS